MKTPVILPENVIRFMDVFKKNGYQIFVVGGAIRNLLLGKKITNWDFTTNAIPEIIQKLFPDNFYNNNYGTVSIPVREIGSKNIFEVTPFRKESDYTDSRHPRNVVWAKKIEEDLHRRDFTINALAYDGENLVDLHQGLHDLENKLIRAVGNPYQRFSEDALRLMRAIRLASELGFILEEKTRIAIKVNSALITRVSSERIREELFKIIASNNPADGILYLKNTDLLKHILPEVEVCFSIPQKSPERHHVFDVGTHLVMALRLCPSTDVITRLSALLHDIGKASTYNKDKDTEIITFYNHEIIGAKQAAIIADRLKFSKKQKEKLVRLVRFHMFTVSEKQTDKSLRRFIRNVGKEYLPDVLDLRIADRLGSGAKLTSWRTELFKKRLVEIQKKPFEITDLAIDGEDVMRSLNIKPGPRVGVILAKLFSEVLEKKLDNNKKSLLGRLKNLI